MYICFFLLGIFSLFVSLVVKHFSRTIEVLLAFALFVVVSLFPVFLAWCFLSVGEGIAIPVWPGAGTQAGWQSVSQGGSFAGSLRCVVGSTGCFRLLAYSYYSAGYWVSGLGFTEAQLNRVQRSQAALIFLITFRIPVCVSFYGCL